MKNLMVLLGIVSCSNFTNISQEKIQRLWLNSINNTSWENGSKKLTFNINGEIYTDENNIEYNYDSSEGSTLGLYFSRESQEWYLYQYNSRDDLIQYGPFDTKAEVSTTKRTVFNLLWFLPKYGIILY